LGRFLVTGGAGYVGSHTVLALLDRGEEVVVLDDLSKGHREALPARARLVAGRCDDRAKLAEAFALGPFDAVLHFAALSLVGESMREPLRYMAENLATTMAVADAAVKSGCRKFVMSSTAALFGFPERIPIDEQQRLGPVSPYGESKLMCERALDWAERIHGLRFASLRYFNAAGADPLGRAGEDHDPETHLVPLAIDAALGLRGPLTVFGTDYPTPDGTGIRDYVHVTDLAEAHLRVLPLLEHRSVRYNLGNGTGYSVREVIETVGRVAGRPVPHVLGPRREGDPAVLVASSEKLRVETAWTPRFPGLEDIVRTAWAWRAAHPRGYGGRAAAA
jgi:UDP-glucose 4-epimerase